MRLTTFLTTLVLVSGSLAVPVQLSTIKGTLIDHYKTLFHHRQLKTNHVTHATTQFSNSEKQSKENKVSNPKTTEPEVEESLAYPKEYLGSDSMKEKPSYTKPIEQKEEDDCDSYKPNKKYEDDDEVFESENELVTSKNDGKNKETHEDDDNDESLESENESVTSKNDGKNKDNDKDEDEDLIPENESVTSKNDEKKKDYDEMVEEHRKYYNKGAKSKHGNNKNTKAKKNAQLFKGIHRMRY